MLQTNNIISPESYDSGDIILVRRTLPMEQTATVFI
nr:MAG TPA: hypothetical protein [Caudoviricetes sp.]